MISEAGTNREVLRLCLRKQVRPIIGEPLFLEYEEVLARSRLMARSPLNEVERRTLLEAFLSVCEWINIYFGWRPNLPDENDNHLIELAVAGGADFIVTNNIADFTRGELLFPQIQVVRPLDFFREVIG